MLVGRADGPDRRGTGVHLASARSTRLPRLSAQSWRYHSANSLSRSVVRHQHVDPRARARRPRPNGVRRRARGDSAAGPSVSARWSARRAPASKAPMSMPTSAAGSSPTGESTLNRPPTEGGTLRLAIPSRAASSRSAPRAGSVVNTRWRCAASPEPPRARRGRQILRHGLGGSAGLADHVDQHPAGIDPPQAPRRPSSGSTFSSTVSRGKNSRPSSSSSFQAGRRSA